MQMFFEISGWIFGLVSCIVAIIQTVSKNKYKKIVYKQKSGANSINQYAHTGSCSNIIQIGGDNDKQ